MGVGIDVGSGVGVAIGVGAGVGLVPPPQAAATRTASNRQGMNRIFNGRMGVFQIRVGIVSKWLRGQIDPGAVAEIVLASIIAPRTFPQH